MRGHGTRVTINFPQELYDQLLKLAKASERSFGREVVWVVRAGLAAEQARVAETLKDARK